MRVKSISLLCLIVVASILSSCNDRQPSVSATLYCDDSFRHIIQQEIDVFEYCIPNNHILATFTPQKEAIEALFNKDAQVVVIGRDLNKDEKAKLENMNLKPRSQQIAVDAIALIVNKDNPVDCLSLKEISELLSGETQRWIDIQPDAPDRRINIIMDDPGSSLAYFMRDSLLNGKSFGPNVSAVGSADSIIRVVKKDPANIGVIGVTWLTADLSLETEELAEELKSKTASIDGMAINDRMDNAEVKTIAIKDGDEFRPYQQNIYSGKYPLTRPIYMVTTSLGGVPNRFYSFVGGVNGQRLIMRTGVMPARVPIDIYEIRTND